jgi:hypothetical protein
MNSDKNPNCSEQESNLEILKNEVLRKIGRNVVLFQKMEHLLKFIATCVYSAPISKLQEKLEAQKQSVQKKTMGQSIEPFFSALKAPEKAPEEIHEIWLSFNIDIGMDATEQAQWKERLGTLIDERNWLIHHLLPEWNITSIESGKSMGKRLDKQREKLLPELERLQLISKDIREYCAFMNSEEGKQQLDIVILRQSPLVAWLFNIAEQQANSDGWISLATAAQFIREHAPQELADFPKRYGYKSLTSIVLETGFFDIREEPTGKGRIRVLYRIKPGLVFDE